MKSRIVTRTLGLACLGLAAVSFTPPLKAQAQQAEGEDPESFITLSPYVVDSQRDSSYGVSNAAGATRVSVPIGNVPQAITVLNQEFIKDTGGAELLDSLKYVSGVTGAGAPNSGQITVRGWNIPGATYRDGIEDPISQHGATLVDMAVVERVEVIKGPSGTLYGSHTGGGIVNLVSKRPHPNARTELKATVGDYNYMRGEVDVNMPLDADKKWLSRFVFAYQDAESLQGLPLDQLVINPNLTFRPNNEMEITVRYMYSNPRISANAFPWFADADWKVSTFLPTDKPFSDLDDIRENETHQFDLEMLYGFDIGDSRWDYRFKARYNDIFAFWRVYSWGESAFNFVDSTGAVIGNIGNTTFADPRWVNMEIGPRVFQERKNRTRAANINLDLTGSFDVGPTSHKIVVYLNEIISENYRSDQLWDYPTMDLNNRVYYPDPQVVATKFRLGPSVSTDAQSFATGAQDNVSFLDDKLIFVAGVRYDRSNSRNINRLNNTVSDQIAGDWSTRFGLVGKPAKGVSIFLNKAETFIPLTGINDFTGLAWKNQVTSIDEIGAKLELFDNRLITTFSYFKMKQDNARITVDVRVNPVTGGLQTVQDQSGFVETKGFEFDFVAMPTKNISILGGYGDISSESQSGVPLRAVPLGPNYRVWGKYSFTDGALRGAYVGAGFEHTARRDINGTGKGFLPAYDSWDALVGYAWKDYNFQLNVMNVFDDLHPSIAVARQIIYPGDSRKIRFTVSRTF